MLEARYWRRIYKPEAEEKQIDHSITKRKLTYHLKISLSWFLIWRKNSLLHTNYKIQNFLRAFCTWDPIRCFVYVI